jgi:hypothetical protein
MKHAPPGFTVSYQNKNVAAKHDEELFNTFWSKNGLSRFPFPTNSGIAMQNVGLESIAYRSQNVTRKPIKSGMFY